LLAKRIIPCLDVKGGRVVKGINFEGLRDAGDPVERAALYERQGADEVVFLDIVASVEERDTLVDLVRRTSASVFIPLMIRSDSTSLALSWAFSAWRRASDSESRTFSAI